MKKKGKHEVNDSSANRGQPERDQFIEGKIGSGYMLTIEGQPHLEDFAEVLSKDGKQNLRAEPESKSKNTNEK